MNTYIIDTNVFLRALLDEASEQRMQAVQLLEAVKKGACKALVPEIVLAEVIWVLKSFYEFPKEKQVQAVESILGLSGVRVIAGRDTRKALNWYAESNVKFVDAMIASVAVSHDVDGVISFDTDFKQFPITWVQPAEIT
jgi:predicted nucleic-acid-binding protein